MSHLTQVAHELYSIWLGQRTSSFVQQFFLFLSSLLLLWSSNKANYKGEKKKKGGTVGEGGFKTIPFAARNKREYQGHG